ncbi:MAG: pyridoxal-phosphate dependent enzyme [Chloroflexota bacterium]|nr:pyridoxal-phosphate dependent enzyme [Chloroflexota bacterium]
MPATAQTELPGQADAGHLAALPAHDPESGLALPTLLDVYRARQVVDRYLAPTPLIQPPALGELLGCNAYVKCENLQPIGAFKVRGGINLLSQLSPAELGRGVVTASTGNHGQSIAYAARLFDARATIHMPERANPLKVAAMRRFGADVVFSGVDFDTCTGAAEADAAARGAYFVHTSNEPRLIAGVGTYALEIIEEVPDLDVLIVPVGGGSGASGACIAGKGINPRLRVIAVQAEGAPAVYETWRSGRFVAHDRVDTFAEGMATRVSHSLPAQILWRRLDDFRLVSDQDLRRAILTLLTTTGLLAEGAGAAALAAAYAMRHDLAGRNVALVLSGGNLTLDALAGALATEQPW